jgi:hypothetical protein
MSRIDKLKDIFVSRRFYGALAMTAAAMVSHHLGMMTPEKAALAVETAWGLYIGSHGLEDAARAFGMPPKVIDVGTKVLADGKVDASDVQHVFASVKESDEKGRVVALEGTVRASSSADAGDPERKG